MMERWIRLSEWAKRRGISKMSAWRLATAGQIEGAKLNDMGRWIVPVDEAPAVSLTVAYTRVSGHGQKADLDRQVARIAEWAAANGVIVDRYVREIGSGLNEKRKELSSLLEDKDVGTIVAEHRDRLARFGVQHLEKALRSAGRKIVVIEEREIDNDLVQDMIDLMTCFSARLYGQSSARNRARRAAEALKA
jgi:putative resolvase